MKPTRTIQQMLADPRLIAGGDGTTVQAPSQGPFRAQWRDAEGNVIEGSRTYSSEELREELNRRYAARQNRPEIYGADGTIRSDDPIDAFLESDAYRSWVEEYPKGPPAGQTIHGRQFTGGSLVGHAGFRTGGSRGLHARAIVSAGDASAGDLIRPAYQGVLEQGTVRQLTLRDLVTVIPTDAEIIEYVREVSRTAAAAPTPESTDFTGTSGTKPQGNIAWEMIRDETKTIPMFVPVTNRILRNRPAVRELVEQYIRDDIAVELEDQMISGDGLGENFTGILNTAGIQTLTAPVSPAGPLHNLRKAKTLVKRNARTTATVVALSAEDSQAIDLIEENGEPNNFLDGGPFGAGTGTIWGMRRVESEAVPVGRALVGDFSKAVLWDLEQTKLYVGLVNDQFIRNQITILGEMEAGFGVLRPAAFVNVALV